MENIEIVKGLPSVKWKMKNLMQMPEKKHSVALEITYPKPRIKNLLKIYSMQPLPIDLHLEVSSLKDFINDQIHSGNPYSFDEKCKCPSFGVSLKNRNC